MGVVRARVESELKQEAETVLMEMGMSVSVSVNEAITLFYERLTAGCSEPFSPHIPNTETIEAMKEVRDGAGLTKYASFDELLSDID